MGYPTLLARLLNSSLEGLVAMVAVVCKIIKTHKIARPFDGRRAPGVVVAVERAPLLQ